MVGKESKVLCSLILGGSASGKSAYAEDIAVSYGGKRLYIATMQPFGNEADERIAKHRKMRENKGFTSLDCYIDIQRINMQEEYDTVLLECMSNLLANEIYREGGMGSIEKIVEHIMCGVNHILSHTNNLVIVSNDVGFDGDSYSDETLLYIQKLGELNCCLAKVADRVIEVVCSIPILVKGEAVN